MKTSMVLNFVIRVALSIFIVVLRLEPLEIVSNRIYEKQHQG